MSALRIGLCQWRVGRPRSVADFSERLDRVLAEAYRLGAQLALLPEYTAMEVAAGLADAPDVARELHAATAHADQILAGMREAAMRHKLWLVPGSLPVHESDRTLNRAPLIAPDGQIAFQDKRTMTRFETESWNVQGGALPRVFDTPWGRIGISVCYDVEFPSLVRAQTEAGAWLVLVPSCTDTMHGFNRVYLSARARAIENQCYVAIAPTVGDAPWSATLDANRGFAAVLGPVDRGFPEDGVLARGALDEEQWLFADLDPARLQVVRRDGEVRNYQDWGACRP